MKLLGAICGLVLLVAVTNATLLKCDSPPVQIPEDWIDIKDGCEKKMRLKIQEEIKASIVYLSMGAYFSRDTVNRPGFAKMFIHAASEERDHGMKLMEYLLVRGKLTTNLSELISIPKVEKIEWENGAAALTEALELETYLTRSIREVIKTCENSGNFNDYNLVRYLNRDILDKKIAGQRDIAGKLSTLEKIMKQNGDLGEFLFDKNL